MGMAKDKNKTLYQGRWQGQFGKGGGGEADGFERWFKEER